MPKKIDNEEYLRRIKEGNILHIPLEKYRGSIVPILHKCINNHTWKIHPTNVIRGVGCPHCNGNAQKTHEQYEQELFEIEADLYPIEKYKSAREKIRHECIQGHIVEVAPNTVLNMKTGCTYCAKTGFDPTKPAHLYYVKIMEDSEIYYKIGITNKTVIERFRNEFKNKQMVVLMDKFYEKGADARYYETQVLKTFHEERVSVPGLFKHMGGNTELFKNDVLQLDN